MYLVLAAVWVSARWAPLQPIRGGKQMTKLMTQTKLISSFVLERRDRVSLVIIMY